MSALSCLLTVVDQPVHVYMQDIALAAVKNNKKQQQQRGVHLSYIYIYIYR